MDQNVKNIRKYIENYWHEMLDGKIGWWLLPMCNGTAQIALVTDENIHITFKQKTDSDPSFFLLWIKKKVGNNNAFLKLYGMNVCLKSQVEPHHYFHSVIYSET